METGDLASQGEEPVVAIPAPSPEAVESIEKNFNDIKAAFPPAAAHFESRWTAWQEAIKAQPDSTSLDAPTKLEEFENLCRLGPRIMPFLVYELARDTSNDHGVFLYNALETDAEYRPKMEEPMTEELLRRRSKEIVELNCSRNKLYDDLIVRWKRYCRQRHSASSATLHCSGEAYSDLLDLGPSIIANVMLDYYRVDGEGFWYELLHELIWGRKMGGVILVGRSRFYGICCDFFNNDDDYDKAPLYVPNEWDIYYRTGQMGPTVWEHMMRRGP